MTVLPAQVVAIIDQRLGAVEPALDTLIAAHRNDVETGGPTDALAGLAVAFTNALGISEMTNRDQILAAVAIVDMFAVAVSRLAGQ